MTTFLDLRAIPSGGFVANEVAVVEMPGGQRLAASDFERQVQGRHVVLATHGFNVDSSDGLASLSKWDALCGLPSPCVYVGVLWPGDSRFVPVVDYPLEGSVAVASGRLLAQFLNQHAKGATGVSMVSHSLGARTMLEAIRNLQRRVSLLILMAGAIEDDCLTNEYADAAAQVASIRVVASRKDWVLQYAFPIGNPVGEILMHGHPYFKQALGREGPGVVAGLRADLQCWQIPDDWDYVHGDYLPGNVVQPRIPPPLRVPGASDAEPAPAPADGWKSSWSAGVIATQFERS